MQYFPVQNQSAVRERILKIHKWQIVSYLLREKNKHDVRFEQISHGGLNTTVHTNEHSFKS